MFFENPSQEKVEELGKLREAHGKASQELEEAKKRIADLEYREEELERLLSRTRCGNISKITKKEPAA